MGTTAMSGHFSAPKVVKVIQDTGGGLGCTKKLPSAVAHAFNVLQ